MDHSKKLAQINTWEKSGQAKREEEEGMEEERRERRKRKRGKEGGKRKREGGKHSAGILELYRRPNPLLLAYCYAIFPQ